MRIIGGEWRSRVLQTPRGTATRPTSDRLRETLFNVLAPRIEGARFADLFAGSGAVGLEALSRGAAHCTFVENSPAAIAALRANVSALGVPAGSRTIHAASVAAVLMSFAGTPFDIVFLDPPYEDEDAYATTLRALGNGNSIAETALVIAEHAAPKSRAGVSDLALRYGRLQRYRVLVQGDAALTFYRINSTPAAVQ